MKCPWRILALKLRTCWSFVSFTFCIKRFRSVQMVVCTARNLIHISEKMGSCEQGKCQQEELFLVCISNYIKFDFKRACISYFRYDFYSNLHNYVLKKKWCQWLGLQTTTGKTVIFSQVSIIVFLMSNLELYIIQSFKIVCFYVRQKRLQREYRIKLSILMYLN